MYWSVAIPRLLSCAEVRCFTDKEIIEYEHFHMSMAKDIQNIPQNTPNPCVLANLGWRDIRTQIDFLKIIFVRRILQLPALCIYRILFLRRFYYILTTGVFSKTSPIAHIIKSIYRYNLTPTVLQMIESGSVPSKESWKKVVLEAMYGETFAGWRFELTLYSKLSMYRQIVIKLYDYVWWDMVKIFPLCKKPCITMTKLLCGTNVLAINTMLHVPQNERICQLCNMNTVENLDHFVLNCPEFAELRAILFGTLEVELQEETRLLFNSLSKEMILLVLLGLEFPFSHNELTLLRYISSVSIHRMYIKRKSLETR